MRCPSCNKDTHHDWEGYITRMGIQISARGRQCSACGETLYDHEEIGRQEQEFAVALVQRGVRTGPEFALVRRAAAFSAVEIADLFEAGERRPEAPLRGRRRRRTWTNVIYWARQGDSLDPTSLASSPARTARARRSSLSFCLHRARL